jgi:hypothetical protein
MSAAGGYVEGRDRAEAFLARFLGRGWLAATRENPFEQVAVDYGLRRGWLRRELSEAHFTPAGRSALEGKAP